MDYVMSAAECMKPLRCSIYSRLMACECRNIVNALVGLGCEINVRK